MHQNPGSIPAPAIPTWIIDRLAQLNLNQGPLANYFQHPAHEGTPKAKAILVEAGQVADALGLDDEVIDGLMTGFNAVAGPFLIQRCQPAALA